jgi:hypothetical protein
MRRGEDTTDAGANWGVQEAITTTANNSQERASITTMGYHPNHATNRVVDVTEMVAEAFLVITAMMVVAGAWRGSRSRRALVVAQPQPLHEPVVVVIPCRNESKRLLQTLDALLASDTSSHLHVVVVDDHSDDDSVSVVRAAMQHDKRLVVAVARGAGKAMALATGLDLAEQHCAGAQVLFLDADVVIAPGGIGGVASLHRQLGVDVLSGLPSLELVSAWEQMLVPAFVAATAAHHAPEKTMDTTTTEAFLNGQVIMTTAASCARAGGWAVVADQVLEDVALARLLKASGQTIALCDLGLLARTRMYTSRAEIFAGFGKNAKALFGWRGLVLNIVLALWLSTPWWLTVAALMFQLAELAAAAVAAAVVITIVQAGLRRTLGWPVWPVLVLPVIYGSVAWVCAVALTRRHVHWRGRRWNA